MADQRDKRSELDLARLYRESATEAPPAELDAQILATARDAITPRGQGTSRRPPWLVPMAAAATLVIGVGLGYRVVQQAGLPEADDFLAPQPSQLSPDSERHKAVRTEPAAAPPQAQTLPVPSQPEDLVDSSVRMDEPRVQEEPLYEMKGETEALPVAAPEPHSMTDPMTAPTETPTATPEQALGRLSGSQPAKPGAPDRGISGHADSDSAGNDDIRIESAGQPATSGAAAYASDRPAALQQQPPPIEEVEEVERSRRDSSNSRELVDSAIQDAEEDKVINQAELPEGGQTQGGQTPKDQTLENLWAEVEQLIDAGELDQARSLLEAIQQQYPDAQVPPNIDKALDPLP